MKATMTNTLEGAVYTQLACDSREEFAETLSDVARGGADAGFHGFIYHTETLAFVKAHRAIILTALKDDAESMGSESTIAMVKAFNCLHGDYTEDEVGAALYGNVDDAESAIIDALAWYALEKVAFNQENK